MAAFGTAPSLISRQVLSGEELLCYLVTGDGSGNTFTAALRTIRSHWINNLTEVKAAQTLAPTYSGGVVTYGSVPTNLDTHYLFLMGWP